MDNSVVQDELPQVTIEEDLYKSGNESVDEENGDSTLFDEDYDPDIVYDYDPYDGDY